MCRVANFFTKCYVHTLAVSNVNRCVPRNASSTWSLVYSQLVLHYLHCLNIQFFHFYKFLTSSNCFPPFLKDLFCLAYYMIQCFANGCHCKGQASTFGNLMAMVVIKSFDITFCLVEMPSFHFGLSFLQCCFHIKFHLPYRLFIEKSFSLVLCSSFLPIYEFP